MIQVLIYDSGAIKDRFIAVSTAGHGDTDICMRVSTLMDMYAGYMVNLASAKPEKLFVRVLQGDGKMSVDAVLLIDDPETQRELDVTSWIVCTGMDNISAKDPSGKQIWVESLTELPFGVSREDCLDCVREWRAEYEFNIENLTQVFPNPA